MFYFLHFHCPPLEVVLSHSGVFSLLIFQAHFYFPKLYSVIPGVDGSGSVLLPVSSSSQWAGAGSVGCGSSVCVQLMSGAQEMGLQAQKLSALRWICGHAGVSSFAVLSFHLDSVFQMLIVPAYLSLEFK